MSGRIRDPLAPSTDAAAEDTDERLSPRVSNGLDAQQKSVYVGRKSKWRNPWRIQPNSKGYAVSGPRRGDISQHPTLEEAAEYAINRYIEGVRVDLASAARQELAEAQLVCDCHAGGRCHADILRVLAERPA